MSEEALKLELINWLSGLHYTKALEFLNSFKESFNTKGDWWSSFTSSQKEAIERGLRDVDNGRTTPHSEVKKKYGL